jgi:DNA-binding transcriptional MerR regulator
MAKIPEKLFFKIGEVCDLTDTQPYVLRFWESEFPQLAPKKNRSGQRIYSSEDIEMVQEIKRLLYDSGFTIAGARKQLEQEVSVGEAGVAKKKEAKPQKAGARQSGKTQSKKVAAGKQRVPHEGNGGHDTVQQLREILDLMAETDRKLR